MKKSTDLSQWQSSLIITTAILITVVMALLMAQSDTLQQHSMVPAQQLPIVDEKPVEEVVEPLFVPLPFVENVSAEAMDEMQEDTAVSPQETCSTSPFEWLPYEVRPGDSIAQLARQHATTPSKIREANCLSENQLTLGQRLLLPPLET